MSTKTLPAGNAAEKLKLSRPMPRVALQMPLPSEGTPAAPVSAAVVPVPRKASRRSYRLGTYLTEEAGARLVRLVAHLKATQGRRSSAPDVIERALVVLERDLGL